MKFGMWSPSNWVSINYLLPVGVAMSVVLSIATHSKVIGAAKAN